MTTQTKITAAQLLKLLSGRECVVELIGDVALVPVGKPGIHRVRFRAVDVDHAARISDESFMPQAAKHSISGDRVLGVL